MVSSHDLRIAERENRENSQTTDLSQGASCTQRPETRACHRGRSRQRRGGDGHCEEAEGGGAVAGRAAGKVRWRGEGSSQEARLLG